MSSRAGASARKVFLIVALSLLSWISTFTGMLDLISANQGGLAAPEAAAIGVAVASLQFMMLYILDALFSGKLQRWLKPLYVAGYALLTLISVTFSFGFYWNLLEARHASLASALSSVSEVQRALDAGRDRLQQLELTFSSLATTSTRKAEQERTRGGTCGPGNAGAGPLQLREADAQRLSYAAGLLSQRAQAIQIDIAALDREFASLIATDGALGRAGAAGPAAAAGGAPGAAGRNASLRELDRKLGLTVSRYNALRSDPQLLEIRDQLSKRAGQTGFAGPDRKHFVCSDFELATALNGAARAIGELPAVETPHLAAIEGEQATFEAFRRLQATAGSLAAALVEVVAGGKGELRGAPRPGALSDRDYLPLGVALFVDFCIFLIAMNRPWGLFHDLLGGVEDSGKEQLNSFLRIFHHAFVESCCAEPKASDLVRPLQDAVFSHNGRYFGVAPLSLPNRGEANRLLSESRYVANVFVALEGRGLVSLVQPWRRCLALLSERRIAGKLKLQGSPFAEANAFRLYQFAPQAWQGIVMRSVLSARDERFRSAQGADGPELRPAAEKPGGHNVLYINERSDALRGEARPVPKPAKFRALAARPARLELPAPERPGLAPRRPDELFKDDAEEHRTNNQAEESNPFDRELVYDRSESQDLDDHLDKRMACESVEEVAAPKTRMPRFKT